MDINTKNESNKKGYFIIIKVSIRQKDLTILSIRVHVPLNRA